MRKLLIIDNNTLSRESIVNIIYCIENDSVVYEAESLEHTHNINVSFEQDDIIVFTHIYQQRENLDYLIKLQALFPLAKILIISHSKSIDHFNALIDNGAQGVINISRNRNDLVAALRSVKAGTVYLGNSTIENSRSDASLPSPEKKTIMSDTTVNTSDYNDNADFNFNILCYANNRFTYEKGLSTGAIKPDIASDSYCARKRDKTGAAFDKQKIVIKTYLKH